MHASAPRLRTPILRPDKADVLRPLRAIAYPFLENLQAGAPNLVWGGRHAYRVGSVEQQRTNEQAVLRVARTDDRSLPARGHGQSARFEIQARVLPRVLAVMALETLAFDQRSYIAGEVDSFRDENGIQAVLRIVVRTAPLGCATAQESGCRQG